MTMAMNKSDDVEKTMEKVLYKYCSNEIIKQYENESIVTKRNILEGLSGVFDGVLRRHVIEKNPLLKTKSMQHDFPTINDNIKNSTEPLLHMAYKAMGVNVYITDVSELKGRLGEWGVKKQLWLALMKHEFSVQHQKEQQEQIDSISILTNSTYTKKSKSEKVNTDFSSLEKIYVQDLKLFQTAKGKYIEGTLLTGPLVQVSVILQIQDERGDYTQLGLHNMLPECKQRMKIAEQKFTVGRKIKISQPYFKIFADGNPGIRVDSPEEVYLVPDESQSLRFENIREEAKSLMKDGDYINAFGLYFDCLTEYKDIAVLLNNRSQTEINLQEYEEAVLDAATVLLLDPDNIKAEQRCQKALKHLDCDTVMLMWKKILSRDESDTSRLAYGSKEDGNQAFKEGRYLDAKMLYTAAIDCSQLCILLNNIAVSSLKLNMLHTSIAAASACLQIAYQKEFRQKAQYLMTKSFFLSGELELATISAKNDSTLKEFTVKQNIHKIVEYFSQMFMFNNQISGINRLASFKEFSDVIFNHDFILNDSIKHCYISGKGRGLKATKDIVASTLLVLDNPMFAKHNSIENDNIILDIGECLLLKQRILQQIKYDGLLAQKLLLLEHRCGAVKKDNENIQLVDDLHWLAFRSLSFEISPFLPQTTKHVKVDSSPLSDAFISNIIQTNMFNWGYEEHAFDRGAALSLRVSLFNHDNEPNCQHASLGNATVVSAQRDIKTGEELTISYGKDKETLKKWLE